MNSIDFSRSRAILVGTAHYTHGLTEMKAAHNSLKTMRDLLTEPLLCGWPLSRVTPLFEDKTTREGLDQQIAELIHDTTDVLLFYYVGHGQLLDGEHLGLALVDTHAKPDMRYATSLRLNDLRTELKYRCRARVKIVILDCCFSGIGTTNTQGHGLADQVQVATKVEGAYTITASRASQKAVHQDGQDGLTYFTKIFAEVVRDGIPGAGAELTLKDIHKEVAARFLRLDLPDGQLRPEPSVLAVDTAEELALARNVLAAQPAPAPPPPESPGPEVRPPPSGAREEPADTPGPSVPNSPFTMSWTGKEPLAAYTASTDSGKRTYLSCLSVVALVLALLCVAILAVPLALGKIKPPENGQGGGLLLLFVMSAVFGLWALLYLLALRVERYLYRTPGWSLCIGPQGIVTTGTFGKREYLWSQVKTVAIEPIANSGKRYGYTGLHVRFALELDAKHPRRVRPAGWPWYHPGTITARINGMVPVCVLGPMTNQQSTELKEALALYGGPERRGLSTQVLQWVMTKLIHRTADGSTAEDAQGE